MSKTYRKPLHLSLASMQLKELNLKHEVRMLKTALIYGDKVDVRSVASSLLIPPIMLLGYQEQNTEETIDLEGAKEILDHAREGLDYEGVRDFLKICFKHQDIVQFIILPADGWELEPGEPEPEVEQAMIFDFMVQLEEDFFTGETIPFFDDAAGYWANTAKDFNSNNLRKTAEEQSKQIAIVSDLISRLPLFERASVDEIFDIRTELEKPLVNFRSEIIKLSKEIEDSPWNKEFPLAVEQLVIEKCEPAILEIEDACKSNKLLSSLVSNFSKKPLVIPATSALGLALSSSTEMPAILAHAISLTTGGAIIATEAVKEWKEKKREIEKNSLYFYYQLGKRFG